MANKLSLLWPDCLFRPGIFLGTFKQAIPPLIVIVRERNLTADMQHRIFALSGFPSTNTSLVMGNRVNDKLDS